MCKMMEDMRKDAVIKTVIEMLKDNIPLEKVVQYSGLSLDEVKKIKEENSL